MNWQHWQQVLQGEVDAVTTLLAIPPISVAVNDSADRHESWVEAREIIVGDKFLAAIGRVTALFGAFHEVGHIYIAGKYKAFPTPHDLEKACDRVGGWLCGRRGLAIGADETLATLASAYGATILDGYREASLHLRIAATLGLDSSASHPEGGIRASIVLAGWLEAMGGRPCPL